MALEGTIKDFGLADIFQLLALQKKTGVLTLESKENTINIYFHEGRIIYADTLKMWEGGRLGRILEKTGKITRDQLERALAINRETEHRLGYILIKENLITREDLSAALQLQMKKLMFHIFRWKEGNYRFIPRRVSYDEDIVTPIDTEYILMEGMRILDEWPLIEKRIPSFEIVYKRTDRETTPPLSGDDKMVLGLVDGESDIGMIIDSSGLGEVETCNSLIRLMDADLIGEIPLKTDAILGKTSLETEYLEGKGESVSHPQIERLKPKRITLLIISAILLILILIAGIRLIGVIRTPFKSTLTVNRLEDIRTAIRLYYLEKGGYPPSLKDLIAEGSKNDINISDPWGRMFIYEKKDDSYELYSAGPDGVGGNEDDIR